MKRTALILDIKPDSGGGIGMCLTIINYIEKLSLNNFTIITTYRSTSDLLSKKYNIKNYFYDKNNFFNKFINFIFKYKIVPVSSFESYLKKLKIDEIFFLSPSYLNMLIKNINYIYTVWDLSHLKENLINLPEHDIDTRRVRDRAYKEASKKAKFIIIGTAENKNFFIKNYECNSSKMKVIKFLPFICRLNYKETNINNTEKKHKNYILYPAQYWEHKNHQFLIDFFDEYNLDDKISNISLICTGHDKGRLQYLKKLIEKKNLIEKITLLNYVSDEELAELYKNSIAVVFPSYIGSHSFPLYEAFYFRKPVLYNQDILSKEFQDLVYLINIQSKKNLYDKICLMIEDKKKKEKIINNAEKKFFEIFNEQKIVEQLKTVLIDS